MTPVLSALGAPRVHRGLRRPPPLIEQLGGLTDDHYVGRLRRSLMFHCYPKASADWRENCMSTFKYRNVFNGRILVSIVSGGDCADTAEVRDWFRQFGDQLEYQVVPNDPRQGLNTTFRRQLRAVQHEPGIVFKAHTKGISHAPQACAFWRNNMALGCLGNLELVERKFAEGYRSFATFKTTTREGAFVMGQLDGIWKDPWPGWHYPGAFYWFDPQFIPEAFFELPPHYYENEAFTCHMGPSETGFCVTPDNLNFWEPLWLN